MSVAVPVLLSICIPAYNRPEWLHRALDSVVDQVGMETDTVEIIVSDDSTNDACGKVAQSILGTYRGKSQYVHNAPSLGMANNWNNAIRLATGRFVQVLHDDDYWVYGGLGNALSALRNAAKAGAVNLFGVQVVNEDGRVISRQEFKAYAFLSPKDALRRILPDSAFVRFPGMVVQRNVYDTLGYFDSSIGYSTDVDMWARIVSRHGLACHACTIACFTIHQGSLTMTMFQEDEIERLRIIYNRVEQYGVLEARELERLKANFFHKFVLGGTLRYLRWRDFSSAKRTMGLFRHEYLRRLPLSLKWLPLRIAFGLLLLPVSSDPQR